MCSYYPPERLRFSAAVLCCREASSAFWFPLRQLRQATCFSTSQRRLQAFLESPVTPTADPQLSLACGGCICWGSRRRQEHHGPA
jgi:hypothetical protein